MPKSNLFATCFSSLKNKTLIKDTSKFLVIKNFKKPDGSTETSRDELKYVEKILKRQICNFYNALLVLMNIGCHFGDSFFFLLSGAPI